MAIYSGFSHEKWWCSIVMLVYQRVASIWQMEFSWNQKSLVSPIDCGPDCRIFSLQGEQCSFLRIKRFRVSSRAWTCPACAYWWQVHQDVKVEFWRVRAVFQRYYSVPIRRISNYNIYIYIYLFLTHTHTPVYILSACLSVFLKHQLPQKVFRLSSRLQIGAGAAFSSHEVLGSCDCLWHSFSEPAGKRRRWGLARGSWRIGEGIMSTPH